MKLLALATVIGAASAFTAPMMTFAVGKKSPAKKAAATKPLPKKAAAATKAAASKAKAEAAKAKAEATKAAKAAAAKAKAEAAKAAKAAKKTAAKPAKAVKKAAAKPAKVVKKVAPKPKPKPAPKKVVAKKVAPPPKKVVSSGRFGTIPSQAIPNEVAPAILDGSLIGDVGFDPCFLSTKADTMADYFNGLFTKGRVNIDGLTWYREAELMHGRICMLAVLGFIIPGFFHFAGNSWTGVDAYAETNPLLAWGSAPKLALTQILAFMAFLEFRRIRIIEEEGSAYVAGNSQRWGQGGWNPFGLNYSPAEYEEKQLQEIKHARLAMIGLLGLIFQANASGVNVVDQLSAAFVAPEYASKAGYYFPEGI